jgi:hypothetical protein
VECWTEYGDENIDGGVGDGGVVCFGKTLTILLVLSLGDWDLMTMMNLLCSVFCFYYLCCIFYVLFYFILVYVDDDDDAWVGPQNIPVWSRERSIRLASRNCSRFWAQCKSFSLRLLM